MKLQDFLKNPYKYLSKLSNIQLEKILTKLSEAYYNTSTPLVTDIVFDDLKDVLYKRNPKAAFFDNIGAEEYDKTARVKLPYSMFSLNKVKPDNGEFEKWIKKYKGKYILSDKLDGISGMVVNKNNKLKLYTRGNGIEGRDISNLLEYINFNGKNVPNNFAIRGELIISKNNFKKISDQFKNARNCVAGLINSKSINVEQLKLVDFICYSIINPKLKMSKQLKMLNELKINTVPYIKVEKIDVDYMINYFKKRRKESKYDIDGIVICDNSKMYEISKDGNPKHNVAFKSIQKDQSMITEVLNVEWNVSRFNVLKPKIQIKPINISGVEINYATAHNAKFIVDNVIGKGSLIKIIRSGDVIPKICEVLSPAKNGKPQMPTIKYKWNETEVDIIIDASKQSDKSKQETNRDVLIKQLTNTMQVLKVKYFSEGFITRLVDNNINTLLKIINIKESELKEIIGENMGFKIYNNLINSLQTTKLYTLMAASNSFDKGIGLKRIKLIFNNIPDIMENNYSNKELYDKIISINSFNDITANIFITGFNNFKKYFNKLSTKQTKVNLKYLINPTNKDKVIENINSNFNGKKVVLTGFRDEKIQNYIEENGGTLTSSISENTYMVICKDKNAVTAKLIKAKELNIPVILKDKFYSKYLI